MSRILVVSHSPYVRDSMLWKSVLERGSSVDLIVPILKSHTLSSADLEFIRTDGVIACSAIEPFGKGHSTMWIPELSNHLRRKRYDLLHAAFEPWSLIPQSLSGKYPTVVQGAESILTTAPWPMRLRRIGTTRVLKNAAGVLSWGDKSLMAFRKMGLPVDTPQEVIPMGIPDPELFSPTPLEGLNGKLRVLFVGRLVKEKGIGTLMEALCQLSIPVVLKIIGEGPLSVYIGESASNCPHVELIFEGSASGQEVARAMSWSHIVVVPSEPTSTWEEQWGRVAVEAMLSGRPTLVSDCGELPAIVGDSRMTFPAGDVDSLRWALANLNKERGTLESLGDSMRISAKRFAPDVLAKRILEFWEKTVERRYLLS